MNNTLSLVLKQVARKNSVDQKLVESVYKSYWKFIKEHINNLSLIDISEEEFASTDTNFNIPYIGKLYLEYSKVKKYNNKFKLNQDVKAKRN